MAITFKITVLGGEKFRRKIKKTGLRAYETRPILKEIAYDLLRVESAIFSSQGRRGGGSWAFDRPQTIKNKLRRGGSPFILIDTGRLMESVTRMNSPYQHLRITKSRIEFTTSHPGAKVHQFGYPPRNIPRRPFMRFTQYDRNRWGKMLQEYIFGGLGRGY